MAARMSAETTKNRFYSSSPYATFGGKQITSIYECEKFDGNFPAESIIRRTSGVGRPSRITENAEDSTAESFYLRKL